MAKRSLPIWKWALTSAAGIGLSAVAAAQSTAPVLPAPTYSAPPQPMPVLQVPSAVVAQPTTAPAKPQSNFATLGPVAAPATLSPVPTLSVAGQTPMPPAKAPNSPDTGMSSKPPAFTVPPPTPKDGAPATTDPNVPAVTNDSNVFSGFPDVQDAFSSLLPGKFKDTKYKWYGFVRVDGIFDTKPMGSTDSFVTSAIPIPQGKGQNVVLTPRYTRLGFDTSTPVSEHEDWTVKTRIEMDFFNGNTSGAFGSFPIRLRFAWIDVGPFLVGQAASVFMDYDVFPNVLDYEGPPGMILMRQPIFAARIPVSDKIKVTVAAEQPYSDIQWLDGGGFTVNPGTGIITEKGAAKNIQNMPDFTANVRYNGDYGHAQVAGIVRKLSYQSPDEQTYDVAGYGLNVTGSLHPWAIMHGIPKNTEGIQPIDRCRILGQFATGHGITRYVQDVNGFGLDATFDPLNRITAIPSTGWFISYEHWWTDKVISVFSYGQARLDLQGTLLPADTYKSADYFTANLIWLPFERFGVGVEVMYGSRENRDGQKGDNVRVQSGVQYRF